MIDSSLLFVAVLLGYLLGSIPFGLLITKIAGLGDIRAIGSGNIGATNVLRTGRKDLAIATLLLDGGKGAAAIIIARALHVPESHALIAGGAAVLGHLFPVWLGFRGGKGVATALGLFFAADWIIGFGACILWLLVALISRYSSLASLVAVASSPILALALGRNDIALLGLAAAALIWLRHCQNIARLIKGEEPKIGRKKPKQS
jgi:glycerol-3-phosphate acyltransferase PlsY